MISIKMINLVLFSLFYLSFGDSDWDFIMGYRNDFSYVTGTGNDCNGFETCYEYLCDILAQKYGNAAYAAVYLHENDSAFCNNINTTLPVKMIVFGIDTNHLILNNTANFCNSFGDCLSQGCNMPAETAAFLLAGTC